jgi:hypothetical protein
MLTGAAFSPALQVLGPGWQLGWQLETPQLVPHQPQLSPKEARQAGQLLAKLEGLADRAEDLAALSSIADDALQQEEQQEQQEQQQEQQEEQQKQQEQQQKQQTSGDGPVNDANDERKLSNQRASSNSSSGSGSGSGSSSSSGSSGSGSSSSSGSSGSGSSSSNSSGSSGGGFTGGFPWMGGSPLDPADLAGTTAEELLEEIKRRIGGPHKDLQDSVGPGMASRIRL